MKKKITKIILAVCLVVAGLPLFAIGARANDDANTNSEMMSRLITILIIEMLS